MAESNFRTHVGWVQQRVAGMRYEQDDELTLVDSGLGCDTFNFVCCARLAPATIKARIDAAIGYFRRARRPFSWWVGPDDSPHDLGEALVAAGLEAAETELGMTCDLARINAAAPPPGLRVERVASRESLRRFARMLAALWNPPDENVVRFYGQAAEALLGPECPLRFYIGWLDDTPVATAEMTVAGAQAGSTTSRRWRLFGGGGLGRPWSSRRSWRRGPKESPQASCRPPPTASASTGASASSTPGATRNTSRRGRWGNKRVAAPASVPKPEA